MTETELKLLYKGLNKFIETFELKGDTNFIRVKNIVAVKLSNLITKDE